MLSKTFILKCSFLMIIVTGLSAKTTNNPIIVVDIGGTHLRFGYADDHGIKHVEKYASPNIHQPELRNKALQSVQDLWLKDLITKFRDYARRHPDAQGASLGFPGPVDEKQNLVRSNNLWGQLQNSISHQQLQHQLGMPLLINTDVSCALARYQVESHLSKSNRFSVLTIGTGLSIKLAESSCTRTQPGGGMGQVHVSGHKLETMVAGAGLVNLARHLSEKDCEQHALHKSLIYKMLNHQGITLKNATSKQFNEILFKAFKLNDSYAVHVIIESTRYLAAALEHYILAVAPDQIILTGGVPDSLGQAYRLLLIHSLENQNVFGYDKSKIDKLVTLGAGDGMDTLIGAYVKWEQNN